MKMQLGRNYLPLNMCRVQGERRTNPLRTNLS
jgi:hypothetical protein